MRKGKPVIGIPAPLYEESRDYRVSRCYGEAVSAAGGFALLLPASNSEDDTVSLLSELDGLLLPGGPDVDPLLYGEEPLRGLGLVKRSNDQFEICLVKAARKAHKPILCVCRGIQLLNVAFGGTLYQDLPSQLPDSLRHMQIPVSREDPTHSLELLRGSYLYDAFGKERIETNSFHHQAIKDVAPGFSVSARSRDDVIEAIEIREEHILGVQWHPEEMFRAHPEQLALFRQLVTAAAIDSALP